MMTRFLINREVSHAAGRASSKIMPRLWPGRMGLRSTVAALAVACGLAFFAGPAMSYPPDDDHQALSQDLIRCAALRGYEKLCLKADQDADHTDAVRSLDKTIGEFLSSSLALTGGDESVFIVYRNELESLRRERNGSCSASLPLDQAKVARCRAYEEARTDPRNYWRE